MTRRRFPFVPTPLALVLAGCGGWLACAPSTPQPPVSLMEFDEAEWREGVEQWHQERIQRLEEPESWLSLAGLFWLEEGDQTFGSSGDANLVFPAVAPPIAGVLRLESGEVTLIPAPAQDEASESAEAATLTIETGSGSELITEPITLASDAAEETSIVALGPLRFFVIDREGRLGVRLKNREHPSFAAFDGIERLPVDPAWRVVARWEAYDEPKEVEIPNVLGGVFREQAPGAAVFEYEGQTYRLEPTGSPDEELFFVFGDRTNAKTTYGGGRFVYAGPPEDGWIVLDFNRSYNPPCVFSPYATCPLPRPEAKLPFSVEAGETLWDGYDAFGHGGGAEH